VTVIYQFTNIWNDFCSARPSPPRSVADDGRRQQCRQHLDGIIEYNVNMAAAIIAAAPTLFVYIVADVIFVRGLMAARSKGERMSFLEIRHLKKRFGALEIIKASI